MTFDLVKKGRERFGWLPSVFRDDPFESTMDSFFDDFNKVFVRDGNWKEKDNGDLVYTLDVPGFNKDNLSVEVAEGVLNISGESEVKRGSSYGRRKVLKRYTVGDISDAKASIQDGVLTIVLEYPKTNVEVKQIEVPL